MRWSEITTEDHDNGIVVLLTALNHIKARMTDSPGATMQMDTNSLLGILNNAGAFMTYETLVQAKEENPAVDNLISNMSKDKITLKGDTTTDDEEENVDLATNTVKRMAKQALKKRS